MCAPAGLICARLLRIPVCYHIHSAESFVGASSRSMRAAVGRALNRALSKRAALIVVPSAATVSDIPHLADRGDVFPISHGAGRAWRMPCPDDAERAAVRDKVRSLYEIPDGRRLLVYAGRYAPHKGVAELVEAIRQTVDGGTDVALVMAGTGWPDVAHDDRLAERVGRLDLGDRVHLLREWLDTDDLRDHMVAADACVFRRRTNRSVSWRWKRWPCARGRSSVPGSTRTSLAANRMPACVRRRPSRPTW